MVVAAAAVTAALLLLDRDKSSGVHYLTSTAATGTIAKTVQADFTLAGARDAMTISLSGTGSSSTSSGSGNSSASTASAATARSALITVSAVIAGGAVLADRVTADRVATDATTTSAAGFSDIAAPTITALVPVSGPVGSSVTLVGSGFTGATAVAFNGRAATFP